MGASHFKYIYNENLEKKKFIGKWTLLQDKIYFEKRKSNFPSIKVQVNKNLKKQCISLSNNKRYNTSRQYFESTQNSGFFLVGNVHVQLTDTSSSTRYLSSPVLEFLFFSFPSCFWKVISVNFSMELSAGTTTTLVMVLFLCKHVLRKKTHPPHSMYELGSKLPKGKSLRENYIYIHTYKYIYIALCPLPSREKHHFSLTEDEHFIICLPGLCHSAPHKKQKRENKKISHWKAVCQCVPSVLQNQEANLFCPNTGSSCVLVHSC